MKYLKLYEEFNLINEDIDTTDDWFEFRMNLTQEIFNDIRAQRKIKFEVINKNQYHAALKEFVKFKEFIGRFPVKYIYNWKELVLENIAKLDILNSINGHSSNFPYDEFYDTFDYPEDNDDNIRDQLEIEFSDLPDIKLGKYTQWCKEKYKETGDEDYKKKYNWDVVTEFLDEVYNMGDILPLFSNGQWLVSDYGLDPLFELGEELIDAHKPEDMIVIINKIETVIIFLI